MKYKDWIICDLKATDSLQLLGTANRHDAKFKFQVDLVSLVGGGWDAFVEVVFGVSDTEARSVALDFADERIRGAAMSAIESAQDRLNEFVRFDLEFFAIGHDGSEIRVGDTVLNKFDPEGFGPMEVVGFDEDEWPVTAERGAFDPGDLVRVREEE